MQVPTRSDSQEEFDIRFWFQRAVVEIVMQVLLPTNPQE